jgi:hypothetical protein
LRSASFQLAIKYGDQIALSGSRRQTSKNGHSNFDASPSTNLDTENIIRFCIVSDDKAD